MAFTTEIPLPSFREGLSETYSFLLNIERETKISLVVAVIGVAALAFKRYRNVGIYFITYSAAYSIARVGGYFAQKWGLDLKKLIFISPEYYIYLGRGVFIIGLFAKMHLAFPIISGIVSGYTTAASSASSTHNAPSKPTPRRFDPTP